MKKSRLAVVVVTVFLSAGIGAQPESKVRWTAFKSNVLNLLISVPSDWKPVKAPNALAFRYEGLDGTKAGIGVLKSSQTGGTIDAAADAEFQRAGNPSAWRRSPARVGGMRAIKIVGIDPANGSNKFVHYYIESTQGMYLVQCQAPADQWQRFSDLFAEVLTRLKFLS